MGSVAAGEAAYRWLAHRSAWTWYSTAAGCGGDEAERVGLALPTRERQGSWLRLENVLTVSESSTRPTKRDPRSGDQEASLGHLLAVWVLVGASLLRLGMDLSRAAPASIPVTEVSAGLLFGTLTVGALWVAGFRPSLRGSVLYFATEQVVYLLLALAVLGAEPGRWRNVGVHVCRSWVRPRSVSPALDDEAVAR